MPRPEGLPKTGGRTKGTPNKKTQALQDLLESKGLNPAEEIARLYHELLPDQQIEVCLNLMAYLYPKRKAAELSVYDETEQRERSQIGALPDEALYEEAKAALEILEKKLKNKGRQDAIQADSDK